MLTVGVIKLNVAHIAESRLLCWHNGSPLHVTEDDNL